jgi:hypothetical protein
MLSADGESGSHSVQNADLSPEKYRILWWPDVGISYWSHSVHITIMQAAFLVDNTSTLLQT